MIIQQMKKLLFLLFIFATRSLSGQQADKLNHFFNEKENRWADSVYQSLSQTERIAQLLIVRANNSRENYFPEISQYIQKYGIGGVCYFGSGAMRQAKQNNAWQKISRVPLLTAIDGEWGLGMRLDSTISFPYQMTLGAIENDQLIFEMGKEIGKECKRMGIHMNFAPVVDVNVNPNNPVINSRSFGDNPQKVATKALAFLNGMQSEGILATAKHFPGHGDTDSDSHHTLPVINRSVARMDSVELFPFKKLIANNLSGIMIAHLYIPAYEKEENLASTLSPSIVNGLLRETLKFNGLIVTDALDMEGVTKFVQPGEIEVRALMAGNDLLLLPKDVPKAISSIADALESGRIDSNYFENKVKKILLYKCRAGLNKKQEIDLRNLIADLNNSKAFALNQSLFEQAIILLKNTQNTLPLLPETTSNTAVLSIGMNSANAFSSMVKNYANLPFFRLPKSFDLAQQEKLKSDLRKYPTLIVALGGTSMFPNRNFGLTSESIQLINELSKSRTVIFTFFGSPLAYREFLKTDSLFASAIIAHQDNEFAARAVAQQLFGALPFRGKLPVSLSEKYPNGFGLSTPSSSRLSYGFPEQVKINSQKLELIDKLANEGIEKQAYPGCQIVVAKEGRIIYSKSFGYQTYEKKTAIDKETIYDLASITKVAATTISLMKLQAENLFRTDAEISYYLPYLKNSNKSTLKISEILTHQAQLATWIPFYLIELDKQNKLNPFFFSDSIDDKHAVRIADNLYIDKNYSFKMYDTIAKSKLRKVKEYKYSDLGFYWFCQIIEKQSNSSLDQYVQKTFYQPMGLQNIAFLPRQHFDLERIAPTENDTIFRKQVVRGDVHDPGAAMLGGVSGHAGLFSNAEDLAAVFQLLIQNGYYAGKQLLDTTLIHKYTDYQFYSTKTSNRRGFGFDKPYPMYTADGPVCKSASVRSYGHSGFTGTYAWADPDSQLVYIFLSNRVYPSAENNTLSKLNIRTKIHQAIYDAFEVK